MVCRLCGRILHSDERLVDGLCPECERDTRG